MILCRMDSAYGLYPCSVQITQRQHKCTKDFYFATIFMIFCENGRFPYAGLPRANASI